MESCSTCGADRIPGAVFCGSCGSRLLAAASGDASGDPLVGRTLNGTYLVQHKVGGGGMGEVYKAIHTKLECPVALKIVKRELLVHSAMVHRFQREARAASKLRHPNVVAVTDFGHSDGTLFMVMEYVTGKSLARVIADDAPLPERRVVHIGAQILSALAEAHANHILHRDLKPENVMIEARRDARDSVKVLDFGIAKVLAEGESASTLTQAGLVCGTPGYMSPEQLRGGDLDPRSDLFSVGVVLYEMLTHKLPFDVPTPMEMLHKHLSEPIPPPGERSGRRISPALEDVIMQALSPLPSDRPGSAAEMRELLLAAVPSPAHDTSRKTARRTEADEELGGAESSRAIRAAQRGTPAQHGPRTPALARPRTTGERTQRGSTQTPAATTSGAWDPAIVERARRDLAPYIGPLAKLIVRRACERARDVADLYDLLALEIPSESDRDRFRHLAPHEPLR
ncbi:MAG TPA: protein kinase [Anaeromyxobacteraceae bacterium]|nr:protein kinase [Anaeromyxobacteraceae bacterium]